MKIKEKGIDRYRPLLGESSFPDKKNQNILSLKITGPSDHFPPQPKVLL
jgi:hypothetical protein